MWWLVVGCLGARAEDGAGEGPADAGAALAAATSRIEEGDVDAALAALTEATRRWPESAELWRALAGWQLASGRLDALGATLASAPPAHDAALGPHRVIGALLLRAAGPVPTGHPLAAVVLEEELAALDARGGPDATFADLVRLVEVVIRLSRDEGVEGLVEERALRLAGHGTDESARAAVAALAMLESWDAASRAVAVAAAAGAHPEVVRLLAVQIETLRALRSRDDRGLRRAARALERVGAVPGVSPAALAAERLALALATTPLPTGRDLSAVAARVEASAAVLDSHDPGDAAWREALTLTLAGLATAAGDGAAGRSALAEVDLGRADPIASVVASLAGDRAALRALAAHDDEEVRALAAAWDAAGPGAAARSWVAVATGAANVGLTVSDTGPALQVSMVPTLVMVLSPAR